METRTLLELIGNTPLVEAKRLPTGPCRLFLKLESQNPGGSIKDRIALSMIEAAEREGRLKPGSTIIEATAGNTGLALALVGASRGYKTVLVVPDKMSREKILHAKALGAEVILTRTDVEKGHPDYYQDKAEKLAKETPNSFYVNQFGNAANPLAHETTTGPEIFRDLEGKVDAIVAGVGSGGTMTGLSRYFARVSLQTEMVLADPVGSILARYVQTGEISKHAGSWLVEGVGEDFLPPIADLSRVRTAFSISDREAFLTIRDLLLQEGILAGTSSGVLIAAAIRYCQAQHEPKNVVTFVCDTGSKYLSKAFNDAWLEDHGFIERAPLGDLRDLIGRRFEEGTVVTVAPDDTLSTAYARMKLYDISQLPVIEDGRAVGIIDEFDLLQIATGGKQAFGKPVRSVMTKDLRTLTPESPVSELLECFSSGLVPIVVQNGRFLGLITKIDYLNSLRRRAE